MHVDYWRGWLLMFGSKEEAEEYKKILLYMKQKVDTERALDEHLGIPDGKEIE